MLRFTTEIFRGDPSRGLLFELRQGSLASWLSLPPDQPLLLSVSQAIALAMVFVGAFGLRRASAAPAPPPDDADEPT